MSSSSLKASILWADKLVEEYLLFRGFMQCHRALLSELKNDKLHEFQVDKIVEELLRLLTTYNYQAMMELWCFLKQRFFMRLQQSYWAVIQHLELSLQRFYLVNSVQNGQSEKVKEFLQSEAEALRGCKEWTNWFQLPFLKDPSAEPEFKVYFTKDWASRLVVSIHNLLTTVFHDVKMPELLLQHSSAQQIVKLEAQITELQRKCNEIEQERSALNAKLSMLQSGVGSSKSLVSPKVGSSAPATPVAAVSSGTPSVSFPHGGVAGQTAAVKPNRPSKDGKKDSGAGTGTGGLGSQTEKLEKTEGPVRREAKDDNDMQLFQTSSPRMFPGHSGKINACYFSGDGGNFATASSDNTVRVQVLPSASPSQAERAAAIFCGSPVLSLAWETRSDRLLILGSSSGEVKAWDCDASKMAFEASLGGTFSTVKDLSANPDGSSVIAACCAAQGSASLLQAYSLRTGKPTQTFEGKGGSVVRAVHHNHNGSLMAAATENGLVQMFDLRSSSTIMEWDAHDGPTSSVLFSPDETSVFSAGVDGMVREWSAHMPGKEISRFEIRADRRPDAVVDNVDLALSPDGKHFIVSDGIDSNAFIFPTGGGGTKTHQRIEGVAVGGAVSSVDWSQQSNTVLLAYADGSVAAVSLS